MAFVAFGAWLSWLLLHALGGSCADDEKELGHGQAMTVILDMYIFCSKYQADFMADIDDADLAKEFSPAMKRFGG